MKVVKVRTTCIATVEEEWLLAVTDEQAAQALAEPKTALDLLDLEDVLVLHVENTDVRDEEDRDVVEVRVSA